MSVEDDNVNKLGKGKAIGKIIDYYGQKAYQKIELDMS